MSASFRPLILSARTCCRCDFNPAFLNRSPQECSGSAPRASTTACFSLGSSIAPGWLRMVLVWYVGAASGSRTVCGYFLAAVLAATGAVAGGGASGAGAAGRTVCGCGRLAAAGAGDGATSVAACLVAGARRGTGCIASSYFLTSGLLFDRTMRPVSTFRQHLPPRHEGDSANATQGDSSWQEQGAPSQPQGFPLVTVTSGRSSANASHNSSDATSRCRASSSLSRLATAFMPHPLFPPARTPTPPRPGSAPAPAAAATASRQGRQQVPLPERP